MAQQNTRGMRLRQTENPRKKNRFWMMQMLCAMLGTTAIILTTGKITGLMATALIPIMVMVGICLCGIFGLMVSSKHTDWFYFGMQILILLLVLILRSRVLEGFRIFWRYVSDARLMGTGWLLPKWELTLPQDTQNLYLALFCLVGCCAISLASCFLSRHLPEMLAVLVSITALVLMVLLGQELSMVWLLGMLAVSVLILLCSGWGSRNAMGSVLRSWLVAILAAAMLLGAAVLPQVQNWAVQIGQNHHRAIHQYRYETEHTTLPEGDYDNYQEPKKAAEAALIVTMEKPQALYLRGFTGSVFEQDQWKPLEKELLVKNQDLLYWLNLNGYNANTQFAASAGDAQLTRSKVTVQNLGGCSLYRYVPFALCQDAALEPENLNTEGVLSDGTRVYSYSIVDSGSDSIVQVIQTLQEPLSSEIISYLQAEGAYRQFVKNFYLQMPQQAKELLSAQWNAVAYDFGPVSELTPQQAQQCALAFLSKCFPETGTPEDIKLPLDNIRGTSYQYATVAVLTMRYFGIPARYAEGYVITEKMASSVLPGQTLAVDGSCARAWVEVYQDGVGWIPMELLPGIGEMIQEDPEQDSDRNNGEKENEDLNPEEAQEDKPKQEDTEMPDPDGGSVVQIARVILTILLKILLVILAIILMLVLRRRYVIRKREKRFHAESVRDGIAWIFADCVNLLLSMGIDRGTGSGRRLCDPAQMRFGQEYGGRLEEMLCLNDRALFSSRDMEETCREDMLGFRMETIEKIHTQVKWYRRLWLKWVRCLY